MYARLVMASAPSNYSDWARDIARLVTSNSPSTSLLSSSTWNVAASTIVDATPAGWTYVGSSYSGETSAIGAVNTGGAPANGTNTSSFYNWVVSAPCASPNSSKLKYVSINSQYNLLQPQFTSANPTYRASISLCQSATSSGVLTNEAYRLWFYAPSSNNSNYANTWGFAGTGTYNVIANQRHITIIKENSSIQAVWEHSNTDLHTRYSQTPAIFYSWDSTSVASAPSWGLSTGVIQSTDSSYQTANNGAWLCNITDVNSGTTYGSVNVSGSASTIYSNGVAQPYLWPNLTKVSTVSSTGATRQLVSPIMFQYYAYGYPTMYVTGTTPVYMCKGNIGAAGDSISVNNTDYIYVPVNSAMGLAVQSS